HDDHEPSLVISPDKNLWHCLGACQAGGSVIDWVMRAEGVSFRHAVELLQNDYRPLAADGRRRPKQTTVPKLAAPVAADEDDATLLMQVIDYYHAALKQSPEALAYLEKRGIANAEAIDTFKLGFANRTLGYRLPRMNRKEGAALRGQLQRLGIIRPSGHEHFNGSLVIPVLDGQDQVQEVYGRKINDHLRPGTPLHLYLPGPHRGVWNGQALMASDEVILCESLIDALTFWCAGYRHVTASYGIEGFTTEMLAAFEQHQIARVLLAYDRDAAGDSAAEALAEKLTGAGFDCYRVQVPKGMDVNEYALQVTPASKSLGVALRSAVWMGRGQPKPLATVAQPSAAPTIAVREPASSPLLAAVLAPPPAPPPVLPASPVPPAPDTVLPESEVHDHEVVVIVGDRRYRLRGLDKNGSFDVLKVNLLVARHEAVHVDTFDLYHARARAGFIKQAALELGVAEDVIKGDLGRVLLQCEAVQDAALRAALKPKAVPALSEVETVAALALLKDPNLLTRIVADFAACGIVGEATNSLVGYLAAVSRKLESPLAVIIQSTSAAGKSSLMEAMLRFVPATDKVQYSAMTGQSLFYMGETDLQHKVLAIAEEEGAAQAAYALKLLQSEGEVTIASTGKDETTGELVTKEYRVEGPVMLLMTTTAIDLDEELMNRCLVLSVNEARAQTEAIHAVQRRKRTLDGLKARAGREALVTVHQHAQRLLKPLAVVNPYAEQLTFLSDQTRTRRDHEKYLTLIDAIALLHQYQRPVKTHRQGDAVIDYVEVTIDDIAVANQLAHEVLGRTLDELPPQTRRLLELIDERVTVHCQRHGLRRSDYRFSRREVREATHWSDTALKVHLARLVEMEYLLAHRGGRGQSFVYELVYDGGTASTRPHLSGLIDVTQLSRDYDASRSGSAAMQSGPGQPAVRDQSGGGQPLKNGGSASAGAALSRIDDDASENARPEGHSQRASYLQPAFLAAAE
ncbi:MAG: toprim domain-containing protein, partial [Gammaproteobacteria bacterium]|nr:toprim domain-containing protein [Gammaproteobacteria bacterium]